MSFTTEYNAAHQRLEGLKWKGQATRFTNSGGLLGKGQNVHINRPLVFDTRSNKLIEVNKLQARLGRLRHRVWSWAEALKPVRGTYDLIMLTLTYKEVGDWRPNHIRDFMLTLRKRFPYIVCYAWVAELQTRGAVHYHVLVGIPKGKEFYSCKDRAGIGFPDQLGDWSHGLTRSEVARTEFYIVTYSGKEYQKAGKFPKGLRMFSVWISKEVLSKAELYKFRLSTLPKWLQDVIRSSDDVQNSMLPITRSVGGGWQVGEWLSLPSPYDLVGMNTKKNVSSYRSVAGALHKHIQTVTKRPENLKLLWERE